MLTIPILVAIAVFIILIVSDIISPLLSATLLFMFYMWAFIAFDLTMTQKVFYPLGILFFLALRANMGNMLETNQNSHDFNGWKFSGFKYHLMTIGVGLVLLFLMFTISSQKGQFLGVATLSISTSGFSMMMTKIFAPAISIALAFIENRMFIAFLLALLLAKNPIKQFVSSIPVVNILTPFASALPVVLTCFTFGIFHVIAYYVQWSLIIWASLIMGLWIASYYFTGKDTTAMDTAHGGWNGLLTVRQLSSVAT